jgi:small subunit ribosomal protein S5
MPGNQRRQQYSKREPRQKPEFDSKLVDLARVTRVAGDKKSRVGVGVAKGADVAQAVEKATRKATSSLVNVPMKEETIPYAVEARFGASHILLKPQRKGRGLVAGGVTRIIAEKAGIKNISAKTISKSRNKLNNALATLAAIKKLQVEVKDMAKEKVENPEGAKEKTSVKTHA